ncbi:MAG: GxGYxYP family putative glycoside hydrolase [Armatimonadota bacterium]|nr:GxGYxYP family putative glycoside hydrolase [Armatimonadota bacterium]
MPAGTLPLMLALAGLALVSCAARAETPEQIVAQRRAMAPKPYQWTVPRSNEPKGRLTVLRVCPDSVEMIIALAALQGIVNRDEPKLYLGLDKTLAWLEYHGGKITIKVELDEFRIFEKFKDHVKGIVVYDTSLDALTNIAITYAGVEDLIPAEPELAETLSKRFGWKIVHDLRGRWQTRLDAYQWAYDNLFPRCTKHALMHYNHNYRTLEGDKSIMEPQAQKLGYGVDYLVEFRIFTWHIATDPVPGEMDLAIKIMESVPFYTPVFGRTSINASYPEPYFVCFAAKYANLHIPFSTGNVSVLSGARIPDKALKQKKLPVRDLGPDKIYIAFMSSEHDNMEHVIGGGPPWHRLGMETDDPYRIWWSDPWRGKVPVGWALGPLLSEMAPTTFAHFAATKTDNDYLMASLTGLCLTSLPDYGAAYPKDQEDLLAGYAKLTAGYMKRFGWTMINPWSPPGNLRTFIKNIPGLEGLLEGYCMRQGMTYDKASYSLDGVPVFHTVTNGISGTERSRPIGEENKRKAKEMAKWLTSLDIKEPPGFAHAFAIGWDFGPTNLKMAADLLPPEYVIVRPDELAALFKRYKGRRAELKSVTPGVRPKGVVTETPSGEDGLIIDTGRIKVEIPWGTRPREPIKRVMGVDGKWRCGGNLMLYNPKSLAVKSFSCERLASSDKIREYQLTYTYSNGGSAIFRLKAIAGRPYLLVEEQSDSADLPSWEFDYYRDFEPDLFVTDAGQGSPDYGRTDTLGMLPWSRWILACRSGGKDRDLMGVFVYSWADWNSGDGTFRSRTPGLYIEFYHHRAGARKFAIAALDKTEQDAPMHIWKELNGEGL